LGEITSLSQQLLHQFWLFEVDVLDSGGDEHNLAWLLRDAAVVSVQQAYQYSDLNVHIQGKRVVAKSIADVVIVIMLDSQLRNGLHFLLWIPHGLYHG